MRIVQVGLVVLALGFVGLVVWASLATPIGASFSAIIADPWGVVTIVDLYLGFILASIVIWIVERAPLKALLWIVPLYGLGNAWLAVWLVVRLARIRSAMAG